MTVSKMECGRAVDLKVTSLTHVLLPLIAKRLSR